VGADLDGIPEDFAVVLKAEPHALSAFERAPESYRKGLLALVDEAGEGDRRANRIALVVKTLLQHGGR
jgi:uncharacterized protein YdeI (YjbR/CyaY-like superfamily)